jgi:hypothetical protein
MPAPQPRVPGLVHVIDYGTESPGAFVVAVGIGSGQESGLLSKKQCTRRLARTEHGMVMAS